jgi:hypothetical protein
MPDPMRDYLEELAEMMVASGVAAAKYGGASFEQPTSFRVLSARSPIRARTPAVSRVS